MKELLAVFIGGGAGSLARYGINKSIESYTFIFPLATFIANLTSCLLVGIVVALIDTKIITNSFTKNLLIVGFCGGFSTFSTLVRENLFFLEHSRAGPLVFYNLLSVTLGMSLMLSGIWLGKLVFR